METDINLGWTVLTFMALLLVIAIIFIKWEG
jgi:hypothetical protein